MNWLPEFVMRGRLQAMLVASTAAMISLLFAPLSFISSGTVALVTLRRGAFEGLIILACSSLSAAALISLTPISYLVIPIFVFFIWLPVWLIAIVLREGRHILLAIQIAILIGIACVIAYYVYNADPAAMWQQILPRMIADKVPVDKLKQAVELTAPFMTGVAAAGGVFGIILGLFLGRWWQAILYNPGGFKQEFLGLRVESNLAMVFLVMVGIAFANMGKLSQIAANISILMLVMYVFVGIAVLHTVFTKMEVNQYAMPVFYMILAMCLFAFFGFVISLALVYGLYTLFSKTKINYVVALFYISLFFMPPSLLPVALIGFSDTWLNIRNRILNQT